MQTEHIASQPVVECFEAESVSSPSTAPNRRFSSVQKWAPILAKFAFVQGLVQIIGLAAGLLIVRSLPKQQYALYTIGNTMLATILVLADSGISSALSAIGGRIWKDASRLSSLLNTALQLRGKLAAVTVLVVVPVLIWLLMQNGANFWMTLGIAAAVLVGCTFELITGIYLVALRLKSEIRQIQTQALFGSLVKLAIVGAALFIFLNAVVALLAVIVGYGVQFWMARRWAKAEIDSTAPRDAEMHSEIISVFRKLAPHSIYYCLQAQIMVWLISIFGNSESVADVGALGRLAVVFALLSSVTVEVVLPAFSRIQSLPLLRRRYIQIVLGYCSFSVLLVVLVALFPQQILSVLGQQYSSLHSEGILIAACGVVSTTAGLLWATNGARAWVVPPGLLIPITIALQAVLVAVLNLSTVKGVLLFSLYTWVPSVIFSVCLAIKKMWGSDAAAVVHDVAGSCLSCGCDI